MSNDITTHGGGAVGSVSRFDVRAAMRHYLAPFKAAEPWCDTIDVVDRCGFATQRNAQGELIALSSVWKTEQQRGWAIKDALAIREAVGPHLEAINDAHDSLNEAMAPAPEGIIRAILGAMLMILRGKPNEGAEVYVDALVWELMEPETGEPFCAPAIAAAAKEIWTTRTFPPSVAEFMKPAKQHQQRIETVWHELNFMVGSFYAAREVLKELAPEKLPKLPADDGNDVDFFEDVPF